MKLLGKNRLGVLYGLDDQTDDWLRNWVSELTHANWKAAREVCRQFPKAKNVANGVFQFPVAEQPQCIEVAMMFHQSVALVMNLKRTTL